MICAIYRSENKEGMYLYVEKQNVFDDVPEELRKTFGKATLAMLFNLDGEKQLVRAKNEEVKKEIQEKGFYLQVPPPPEDLLKDFKKD